LATLPGLALLPRGLEFYLDVSRMRFDDAFVEALQPKFEKAFQDMAALEGGAIANDENRMVGHWLRDPKQLTPELTRDIVQTLEQIEAFTRKVHTGAIHPPSTLYRHSFHWHWWFSLGPQFVAEALAPFPPLAIHFIDNSDPAGIDSILTRLRNRLASTLWLSQIWGRLNHVTA